MDIPDLNILHDHYKESFSQIREREKQRDLLFLVLIALLGSLFLEVQYPADLQRIFNEISTSSTKKSLNALNALPVSIITSATWTVFLVIMLRYCQNSITVDRQYKYLHKLEDTISSLLGDDSIYTREGKAYLKDYPSFSNCVWIFYTGIFPLIVIGLQAYLIYLEFGSQLSVEYNACYDSIMAVGVFISLILYRGKEFVMYIRGKFKRPKQKKRS